MFHCDVNLRGPFVTRANEPHMSSFGADEKTVLSLHVILGMDPCAEEPKKKQRYYSEATLHGRRKRAFIECSSEGQGWGGGCMGVTLCATLQDGQHFCRTRVKCSAHEFLEWHPRWLRGARAGFACSAWLERCLCNSCRPEKEPLGWKRCCQGATPGADLLLHLPSGARMENTAAARGATGSDGAASARDSHR